MNTFDSTKTSLEDILKQVCEGKIQLPDFQRGWVWDDDHIKDLLSSIARSFPVGAIMLLETGGEVRFQKRVLEGLESNIASQVEPENLILDGQQRLTTLTQALKITTPVNTRNNKGKRIQRYYYFDMKAAVDDSLNLLDAIVSVNENKQIWENFNRDLVLDVSTQEKECERLFFPCNKIMNSDDWQHTLYGIAHEKMELYFEFQNKILSSFRQYNIPVIQLKKETSKEAVCLVFEKVNTGGVSLDVFELVTASYAADDYNLRDDWFGKKGKDEDASRQKRLVKHDVLKGVGATQFLQAVTLIHTHKRKQQDIKEGKIDKKIRPVSAKRSDILELPLQSWKDNADTIEQGFLRAEKFLKKESFYSDRELPYNTQIVPLAAVLSQVGEKWLEPKVYQKLSQWFWCGVLGELYGGAVETRIALDYEQLLSWFENDSSVPKTVSDATFQAERLNTLSSRLSAAYKGINTLVLREGAQDWFWKAGIKELDLDEVNLDIHHIFPQNWCKERGIPYKKYNCILNKTPLSYKANRKFGGDAPSDYLKGIQQEKNVDISDEDMDKLIRSHQADPSLLRSDNYDDFVKDRSNRLSVLIEKAMGKSVVKNHTELE